MTPHVTDSNKRDKHNAIWADLGELDYSRAMALMGALQQRVREKEDPGYILFLEHPPTITLGYSLRGDEGRSAIRSEEAELAAGGIGVVEVDRGGKATYHGPGQLVCYPVLSLKTMRLGVKRYVGKLMELTVAALRDLGAEAELDPRYPGVWVGGAKVAAVGVRVQDRVSSHGFAINVDPDLAKFGHIVPCGIPDKPVTSLKALGLETPQRTELLRTLLGHMESALNLALDEREPSFFLEGLDKEAG